MLQNNYCTWETQVPGFFFCHRAKRSCQDTCNVSLFINLTVPPGIGKHQVTCCAGEFDSNNSRWATEFTSELRHESISHGVASYCPLGARTCSRTPHLSHAPPGTGASSYSVVVCMHINTSQKASIHQIPKIQRHITPLSLSLSLFLPFGLPL